MNLYLIIWLVISYLCLFIHTLTNATKLLSEEEDLPTIIAEVEDYNPYLRHPADYKIIQDGDFCLFEAPTEDPRNGEKLGYKVEIVSGE